MLDTNILVSACWKPGGNEDVVLEMGLQRKIELCATLQLWAEYEEVLHRKKFQKHESRIEHMLMRLHSCLAIVPVATQITLAIDADDNIVLESAMSSQAAYIVTGNLKDFPLDWPVARIVNARQFLDYFSVTGSAVP